MPSRRTFLAGTGVVAAAGCVGVRADAARRRDRVAAAVSSSPDVPEPIAITDDHRSSAVEAFETAQARLESEGGRPADHGYGPNDDAPHADAATRWDGVRALRDATWTLERHVGRRRAQRGMSETDVRERLDDGAAAVDGASVEYAGGDREACLVQTAAAEVRRAEARRSLDDARSRLDGGTTLADLSGGFATARLAEMYATDAEALQAPLSGDDHHAGWFEAVYEATGDPRGPSGVEHLTGIGWWELTRSTTEGLRELADRRYEEGRPGGAALAGVSARHHATATQHFVETVESVPTTLEGVLDSRERAVAAVADVPNDGDLERRLLGDAMDVFRRADGGLRARADRTDRFYRGLGDEDDRRERAAQYLVAAALAERVAPVVEDVRDAT